MIWTVTANNTRTGKESTFSVEGPHFDEAAVKAHFERVNPKGLEFKSAAPHMAIAITPPAEPLKKTKVKDAAE